MAFDTDMTDAQLGRIIDELADTVTVSGQTVRYNRVSLRASDFRALPSDVRLEYKMTIATQKSDWTTAPATTDVATISSTRYRVLDTTDGPMAQDLRLHLGPEFSG